MDETYERFVLRVSGIFLFAAAVLILLGLLGQRPSPVVVIGLIVFTMAVYALFNSGGGAWYLRGLWLGALIPTLLVFYGLLPSWSPGELQALGGIVGMVGVVNLFLRPVYRLLFYVVENSLQIAREIQEERSS